MVPSKLKLPRIKSPLLFCFGRNAVTIQKASKVHLLRVKSWNESKVLIKKKNTFSKNKKPTDNWKMQVLGQRSQTIAGRDYETWLASLSWEQLGADHYRLYPRAPDHRPQQTRRSDGQVSPGLLRTGKHSSIPHLTSASCFFIRILQLCFCCLLTPTALHPIRCQSLYFFHHKIA